VTSKYLTVVVAESIDNGYVAYVKELPGCLSQGETIDEAIENVLDVAKTYLELMLEDKLGDQKAVPGTIVKEQRFQFDAPDLMPA
jgi:predicted RNase H-like HicB family nuclease